MQAYEYFSKKNTALRIVKLIGNILFYVLIIAVIVFGIIGVVGRVRGVGDGFGLGGYNFYVVASNSMAGVHPNNPRKDDILALGDTQFEIDELVVVRNLRDKDELHDLDIVTFYDPKEDKILVHRIVKIETDSTGNVLYTTQGDAVNRVDGSRTKDEFKGVLVANWGKKAGNFVKFLQSGYGIAAIALTFGVLISAWLVYDYIKNKHKVLEPDDLPEDEGNPKIEENAETSAEDIH